MTRCFGGLRRYGVRALERRGAPSAVSMLAATESYSGHWARPYLKLHFDAVMLLQPCSNHVWSTPGPGLINPRRAMLRTGTAAALNGLAGVSCASVMCHDRSTARAPSLAKRLGDVPIYLYSSSSNSSMGST